MKASKQHFELVQRILHKARETQVGTPLDSPDGHQLLDTLALWFADAFDAWHKTHSGARFDRARFLKGCGYKDVEQK